MLLKYKYEKWLQDTVKFKKGLNSVITSIDERLHSAETVIEELPTTLQELSNTILGTVSEEYALKTHNHDEVYSAINHTHDNMANISFFTVNTAEGITSVKISDEITDIDNISINDYSEYFTIKDIVDGYVIIEYDIPSEDVGKVFSLVYGDSNVSETKYLSIQTYESDENNVRITCNVTDDNGDPVTSGSVQFKLVEI